MSSNNWGEACQNLFKQYLSGVKVARDINPDDVNKFATEFVRQGLEGKRPNILSMVNEYSVASLLSGPGTPIVNVVSNALKVLTEPIIGLIKAIPKGAAARREARAMFSGLMNGLGSDLIYFGRAFKSGVPIDFELSPKALGMTQEKFNEVFAQLGGKVDPSTGNVDPKVAQEVLAQSYDYVTKAIPGPLGELIRIPIRATVAIDEYFKARLRNQQTMAIISRIASRQEAEGKGSYDKIFKQLSDKAFDFDNPNRAEYVDRLTNTFKDYTDPVLAIHDIRNYATDGTFQTRLTGFTSKVEKLKTAPNTVAGFVTNMVVPFLRTPWNITMESAAYTPGLGFVMRPGRTVTSATERLTVDGQPFTTYRTDTVKMPLDDLVARQLVGVGMMTGAYSMWESGIITGAEPQDAAARQEWLIQGKKPYSIKVGDKWYSYGRLDPFTMSLGLVVDGFDFYKRVQNGEFRDVRGNPANDKLTEEAMKAMWSTVKSNVMNRTFFQGFAELADAIGSGGNKVVNYLENLAKRAVPAGVAQTARALDPYEREATTLTDKLQQRIPVLREDLPAKYAPISPEPGTNTPMKTDVLQALTGFGVAPDQTDFQKKLAQLDLKTMPKSVTLDGVEMTTEQLGYYKQQLNKYATQMLGRSIDNLVAMKNKTVASNVAKKQLTAAAKTARARTMMKYPDLRDKLTDAKLLKKLGPGGLE